MLKLLGGWLRAGVFEGGTCRHRGGHSAGLTDSPLLANIALHVLDEAWQAAAGGWGSWCSTQMTW